MQQADYVVHCAAIAGIDTVIKSPVDMMRINMIGFANMHEAAYAADVSESHLHRPLRH